MKHPLIVARCGNVQSAPENTLAAFAGAIAKGADTIELDVHLTHDSELIVHHDFYLGRTDNGHGYIFFYPLPDWMQPALGQQHILDWMMLNNANVSHLASSLIEESFVARLHRQGFQVHGSNLNTEQDMQHGLIAGIDQFSTSQLELALKVRHEV